MTTVHHPYYAGPTPRWTYLAAIACLLAALAAALVALVLVFTLALDQAVLVMAGSIALWGLSRVLEARAWESVAWCDRDAGAEPGWLTAANLGGQLVLLGATVTFAISHGPAWGAIATLTSVGFTWTSVVLAVRGRRTRNPHWQMWRDVTAVGMATIAAVACCVTLAVADEPALWALWLAPAMLMMTGLGLAVGLLLSPRSVASPA